MGKKYKKICKYLNYVEHLLILVSTVSIAAFTSIVRAPVRNKQFVQSLQELKNIGQL